MKIVVTAVHSFSVGGSLHHNRILFYLQIQEADDFVCTACACESENCNKASKIQMSALGLIVMLICYLVNKSLWSIHKICYSWISIVGNIQRHINYRTVTEQFYAL